MVILGKKRIRFDLHAGGTGALCWAYCTFQFPELLSKALLLSFSQGSRAFFGGRGHQYPFCWCAAWRFKDPDFPSFSGNPCFGPWGFDRPGLSKEFPGLFIRPENGLRHVCRGNRLLCYFPPPWKLFLCGSFLIVLVSGVLVNPVRQGAALLQQDSLIQEIRQVTQNEPGTWIVDNAGYPVINLSAIAGRRP